jgi:hypothetical protein
MTLSKTTLGGTTQHHWLNFETRQDISMFCWVVLLSMFTLSVIMPISVTLLALPSNIRHKNLFGTNTLAYFVSPSVTEMKKSLMTLSPGLRDGQGALVLVKVDPLTGGRIDQFPFVIPVNLKIFKKIAVF